MDKVRRMPAVFVGAELQAQRPSVDQLRLDIEQQAAARKNRQRNGIDPGEHHEQLQRRQPPQRRRETTRATPAPGGTSQTPAMSEAALERRLDQPVEEGSHRDSFFVTAAVARRGPAAPSIPRRKRGRFREIRDKRRHRSPRFRSTKRWMAPWVNSSGGRARRIRDRRRQPACGSGGLLPQPFHHRQHRGPGEASALTVGRGHSPPTVARRSPRYRSRSSSCSPMVDWAMPAPSDDDSCSHASS